MTLKERYEGILTWFEEAMPSPQTELDYGSPFQLLVAVILSAQCTDKRVNLVTPALFEAFPDARAMARADFETLHPFVTSVNYHNSKTRALMGMSRMLVEEFGGEVPSDIDSLMRLPGVGRKSANVVLSVIFNRDTMPVDTHVFRVSERLGLTTDSKTPLTTEQTLTKHIPPGKVGKAHHWLILHGRYVCKARKPDCPNCGLRPWCRHFLRLTTKKR